MDNALLISLQSQRMLQRRMDATANNLANATTTGFKADAMRFQMMVQQPASSQDKPNDVRFVADAGIVRNMSQGTITSTGSPLDLALNGDGFFMIKGPNGTAYTRDGSFTLSADGTLVTKIGYPVLSQTGTPLVFDPQDGEPTIDQEGEIRVAGVEAGQIGVANFADSNGLQEIGDNLFTASGQTPQKSDARVVQFSLESSNVQPVLELTNLIEISRAYESAAQMLKNSDDLRKQAVQTMGQAA